MMETPQVELHFDARDWLLPPMRDAIPGALYHGWSCAKCATRHPMAKAPVEPGLIVAVGPGVIVFDCPACGAANRVPATTMETFSYVP